MSKVEIPPVPPMGTWERVRYCEETHRMALELYNYILFHPIKWWKLYRVVSARNKATKASR